MAMLQVHSAVSAVTSTHVNIDVRRNFASPHLVGAMRLSKMLADHERVHGGDGFGPQFEVSMTFATAVIMMTCAAQDAALFEARMDAELLNDPEDRRDFLQRAKSTFKEVEQPISLGSRLYQQIKLLRDIRNALVHAKAEWASQSGVNAGLSGRINNARLKLSPLAPDPKTTFPYGCMSAGVTTWAVTITRTFVDDLRSALGASVLVWPVD